MNYDIFAKQFPEVADLFAELENRIGFLENSLPYHTEKPKVEIEIRRPEPQIKTGEFNHLSNKVNEHLDAHKKRRNYKYE